MFPFRPSLLRFCVLGLGLLLVPSASASGSRLALHPLVVVDEQPGQQAELTHVAETVLARIGITATGGAAVSSALTALGESSCLGRDACLARLAGRLGAEHVILLTIAPNAPLLVLTGRVVAADGAVVREVEPRAFPRDRSIPREQELAAALGAVLDDLDPGNLPRVTAAASMDPLLVSPPARSPTRPLRIASFAVGGLAAVLAGSGGVALAGARGDAELLRGRLDDAGRIRAGDDEALRLHRSLTQKEQASRWLLVGGGVALGSAVTMFVLSADRSGSDVPAQLAVTPQPGGGVGIAFTGRLR